MRRLPSVHRFWLAVAWALLVLSGYYITHKPVQVNQVVALGRVLVDLILGMAMTSVAGGVGYRLFPGKHLSRLEAFAVQAALGWGVIGLGWFGLGLAGLYQRWLAWGLFLAVVVFLRREIVAWLRALADMSQLVRMDMSRWLAVMISLLVVLRLLFALAPPLKWDTLAYHLWLPRQYVAAGRFLLLPENPLWGRSQVAEMIYTWGMLLHRMQTAAVCAGLFSVVLFVGVLGMVARYASAEGAWVAVGSLLAGLTFRGMLHWAYVDGLVALFGAAVLIVTLQGMTGRMDGWPLWAGALIGLAMGVKFTAGLLLLPLMIVLWSRRRSLSRPWWREAFGVAAIAGLGVSPWLLKNAMVTGNPLYPHFWPTPWTPEAWLSFYQGSPSLWLDPVAFWLPLAATWLGVEGGYLAGVEKFFTDIGPLLVLLGVPGVLAYRHRLEARVALLWLGVGWAAMVLGGMFTPLLWETRYFFALLPAAALAAGLGWDALVETRLPGIRPQRLFGVFVGLVLAFSLWQDVLALNRAQVLGVLLGTKTEAEYLETNLGWHAVAVRSLADLPSNARVQMLWDERGLYAPVSTRPDPFLSRWFLDRRTYGDAESILQAWCSQGISHVLLYRLGGDLQLASQPAFTPEDRLVLEDFLQRAKLVQDFGGVYQLFALSCP